MPDVLKSTFDDIYNNNLWSSKESKSGLGSELTSTAKIRTELPELINKYGMTSMLDIPCGDYNWMKEVNLSGVTYIGADIVEGVIANNKTLYPEVDFRVMDLTKDVLPTVDLIFVRDCLGHLSNANVFKALENIKASGSGYLLTTCFTKYDRNSDIVDGGWRPINLMLAPFRLKPQYLINENCTEGFPHYNDKCLVLFKIDDLYSL